MAEISVAMKPRPLASYQLVSTQKHAHTVFPWLRRHPSAAGRLPGSAQQQPL